MNISKIRQLVNSQAEDEGLWFMAETASEAYLQQELRRLHLAIEGTHNKNDCSYCGGPMPCKSLECLADEDGLAR